MISREEYARALEAFFMEATGMMVLEAGPALAASAKLRSEIEERLADLRDSHTSPVEALSIALGMIDELVTARWDAFVEESYALFVDLSGGVSKHNPRYEGRSDSA